MKKIIFVVFVCIILTTVSGCNASIPRQASESGTKFDAGIKTNQSTENLLSKGKEVARNPNLPALDNIMTYSDFVFTISTPSAWEYDTAYIEHEDDLVLLIDCQNSDITMWVSQIFSEQTIERLKEAYKDDDQFIITDDFRFADGGVGFYSSTGKYIDFVNVTEHGIFIFSVNYDADPEWYAENEALIHAVAKTLAYNPPWVPEDNVIAYDSIIDLYRDIKSFSGDAEDAADTISRNIAYELNLLYDEQRMYELRSSIFEAYNFGDSNIGYALHDINNDGVPELFILSDDFYDIYAIYTLNGGVPVLLGAYWSRNHCAIDKDGIVYVNESNGASDSNYASYMLDPDSRELILIEALDHAYPVYLDNPTKDAGLDFNRIYGGRVD